MGIVMTKLILENGTDRGKPRTASCLGSWCATSVDALVDTGAVMLALAVKCEADSPRVQGWTSDARASA